MRELRDVFGGVIINPQIHHDVKEKRKIQQGKIQTIFLRSNAILNRCINPENSKRFDQKIQSQY